jgi:uroporphyrinogen-III synthase
MENKIRIVITKKLLPTQKQYLLNAYFSVVEADFIGIKHNSFKIKKDNDFLIFTSQNAVESVLKSGKREDLIFKKCFCVGEKTKALLEQNGFEIIQYSEYAAELASIICNQYQKDSFTFFCGNLRRNILPDAMQLVQIPFEEIEVYKTVLTPTTITSKPNGILFFSPSGVESYLKKNTITDETSFAIGTTTAEALESVTTNIIIANQPTVENLIIQCIKHYSKK